MSKKILIVEDSEDMQVIYRDMFEGEDGYEIDIVGGVEDAEKKLGSAAYDLVVLDIIMEPVGGDTLFFRLREAEETKELPVIVASVLTPSITEAIKQHGHVEVLQKPVKKEALFEQMKEMIG